MIGDPAHGGSSTKLLLVMVNTGIEAYTPEPDLLPRQRGSAWSGRRVANPVAGKTCRIAMTTTVNISAASCVASAAGNLHGGAVLRTVQRFGAPCE